MSDTLAKAKREQGHSFIGWLLAGGALHAHNAKEHGLPSDLGKPIATLKGFGIELLHEYKEFAVEGGGRVATPVFRLDPKSAETAREVQRQVATGAATLFR